MWELQQMQKNSRNEAELVQDMAHHSSSSSSMYQLLCHYMNKLALLLGLCGAGFAQLYWQQTQLNKALLLRNTLRRT
jgi:hypothetical protein